MYLIQHKMLKGFSGGSDGKESAVQETRVPSLGREDPLEESMATHSSILAWELPEEQKNLKGYSPWGHKESDTTEQLTHKHLKEEDHSIHPSVQFSRSVISDSLQPHELQHARPPCPSPTPRVHSDSRPSSQ